MRLAITAAVVTSSLLCAGCWDFSGDADTSATDDDETENPNPHATIVAEAEMALLCGSGATEYTMVAVQVACEPPPPAPCTMPSDPPLLASESATCAAGGVVEFRSEVLQRGRYAVQLIPDGDWGAAICLGQGLVTPTPVTQEDLDARAELVVDSIDGAPCP